MSDLCSIQWQVIELDVLLVECARCLPMRLPFNWITSLGTRRWSKKKLWNLSSLYLLNHPTNRRSTQSLKSIQERKENEYQWGTDRHSHWYRMNKWNLMQILFGYIAKHQPTERTSLRDDDDALQTMQCHHVHWRMYLFFCFFPCTHTQTTTQHTQTQAAAWPVMIWWEENDEKKERERKKKKEEEDVMNVHYAQCREMKEMKKMREFVIFFDCAQWAEHIKLGSNPSSQYLPHLVCCYIISK